VDDFLGAERPADAPAGVAPILGQAIDEDDRVAVDVLDVGGGRDHLGQISDGRRTTADRLPWAAVVGRRSSVVSVVDVVGVELIEDERAAVIARQSHPLRQPLPLDQLAGGVGRVAQQHGLQPATLNLALDHLQRSLIPQVGVEQDGDGDERLEDAQ